MALGCAPHRTSAAAARCQRSRPAVRPCAAAPPRMQLQHRRAAPVRAAAGAPSTADLQAQLAAKEAQLTAMFESGQPMPAAAVVASLRSEIAALEAQLAGRPVVPLVQPGPIPAALAPAPAAPRPGGAVRPRSHTEELAAKAYELVEQQLRSNQGMGTQEDVEIAHLEAENSALRAQAYSLLQRQQQLETLLAEVRGAKPPELLLETTEDLLARMKRKLQRT